MRSEGGATAVEFGLIALPFATFLFLIFEVGLMFFAATVLDASVKSAVREIRTGEAQSNGATLAAMKTGICDGFLGLFGCSSDLVLSVRKVDSFADVTLTDPVSSDGTLSVTEGFDDGGADDYVIVQAFLPWSLSTGLFGSAKATLSDGRFLLVSTTLFRNEPFDE
ncbi:TadE/TadG family type IV pilus assembly protein [Jiella sonneratiae]|uniref:Pilus assembly protein n=1 Tax=Jiella sonneratiae TaxID=2816856 RepID=A0ABS3J8D9_9HYPH|nr:TadE/TadG family type IV pilus assembly protein [Jiella sonneratiae]MBO0905937.1 pilus assembly protein [Jiella sonneratiae]